MHYSYLVPFRKSDFPFLVEAAQKVCKEYQNHFNAHNQQMISISRLISSPNLRHVYYLTTYEVKPMFFFEFHVQ